MKYILLAILIYYIYNNYIALPPGNGNHPSNRSEKDSRSNNDEYIDYEEVD